jgi:hypothetical protein
MREEKKGYKKQQTPLVSLFFNLYNTKKYFDA